MDVNLHCIWKLTIATSWEEAVFLKSGHEARLHKWACHSAWYVLWSWIIAKSELLGHETSRLHTWGSAYCFEKYGEMFECGEHCWLIILFLSLFFPSPDRYRNVQLRFCAPFIIDTFVRHGGECALCKLVSMLLIYQDSALNKSNLCILQMQYPSSWDYFIHHTRMFVSKLSGLSEIL